MSDNINHPAHYTQGRIEVIEYIEDQKMGYCLGNAIKYISRARFKGKYKEDLEKAAWYINRAIKEFDELGSIDMEVQIPVQPDNEIKDKLNELIKMFDDHYHGIAEGADSTACNGSAFNVKELK